MASENVIRILLERQPQLLSYGQTNTLSDRSWILVEREVGIPSEEGGLDRWYLDHLFIDQCGIPTLVEVKLFGRDHIRRTVIGQMLDYATFASKYWPPETIREMYEESCRTRGDDPLQGMSTIVNEVAENAIAYDEFWSKVHENIRVGNIRLVLLTDKLSDELKEVIEFLQEQMNRIDVCGVEIGQYLLENHPLLEATTESPFSEDMLRPDYEGLYSIAEKQAGYFSANQAKDLGFSWERLSSNTKSGRFMRMTRGVYRLVQFPSSSYEELFIAWLRTGQTAVISHESALSLFELSDVLTEEVHVTVPRTSSRRRKGVRQHTNRISEDEITNYNGLPVTTVARTIADVARSGHPIEIIEKATRESLERDMTTREELVKYSDIRGGNLKTVIQAVLLSETE